MKSLTYITLLCAVFMSAFSAGAQSVSQIDKVDNFESYISSIFEKHDCQKFEELREVLLKENLTFKSGYHVINNYYNSLDNMCRSRVEGCKKLLADWGKRCTKSNALVTAKMYFAYRNAMQHRGRSYVHNMSEEASKAFSRNIKNGLNFSQQLNQGESLDPIYFVTLIQLLSNAGASSAQVDKVYRAGVNMFPDHMHLHQQRAQYLLPRWGGSVSEVMKYAEEASALTKKTLGDGAYALIAYAVSKFHAEKTFKNFPFKWNRVKKGYDDLLKLYPDSEILRNDLLKLSYYALDRESAKEVLKVMPAEWGYVKKHVWKGEANYRKVEQWAYETPTAREQLIANAFVAISHDDIEAFKKLFTKIDMKVKGTFGQSLMEAAASENALKIANYLVGKGYPLSEFSRLPEDDVPLSYAIRSRHIQFIDFLLANGVSVNASSFGSDTAIGTAIRSHHVDVIKRLLREKDLMLNVSTKDGPVIWIAYTAGSPDVFDLILKDERVSLHSNIPGTRDSILDLASRRGDLKLVQKLLQERPDAYLTGSLNILKRAKKKASEANQTEVVTYLDTFFKKRDEQRKLEREQRRAEHKRIMDEMKKIREEIEEEYGKGYMNNKHFEKDHQGNYKIDGEIYIPKSQR